MTRKILMVLFAIVMVVFKANGISKERDVILVGISGGTGSGKTYISEQIKDALGDDVLILNQDYYYKNFAHLRFEERAEQNFDHPDSIDFDLLIKHLTQLKAYSSVSVPTYDFKNHCRREEIIDLSPKHLVLVEGILIFTQPEILDLLDIKIFVDTDDDIRFLRRVIRDTTERGRTLASICTQYTKTVHPMFKTFVSPSKKHADLIVSGNNDNEVAVDLLIALLKKKHQTIAATF